jgi:hypothetical protein
MKRRESDEKQVLKYGLKNRFCFGGKSGAKREKRRGNGGDG